MDDNQFNIIAPLIICRVFRENKRNGQLRQMYNPHVHDKLRLKSIVELCYKHSQYFNLTFYLVLAY